MKITKKEKVGIALWILVWIVVASHFMYVANS